MSQTNWFGKTAGPKITVSEQFDQALVCLEELTKNCKGLYTYAKKRFAIEKEYAKSLQKLTRSTLDATLTPKGVSFQGGLGPSWHSLLRATQECAETKLAAAANLERSVLASLSSVFEGELSKSRKELSSQGHQSAKNLQDVVQLLHKAQSSYVSGAQDWQAFLLQLHRDLGGEWRAMDNQKQRDKEAGLSRKCEEAKQSYLAAVRQANNSQHLHHFDQMPPLLTQLSELSEDIALVARQSLVHMLEQADLLQRSVAKQTPRVPVTPQLQATRRIDPKSYTNDFIFCHMTSEMVEPPRPFVFEEFLMEDDAAQLFFQKSRYECLQVFPTSDTLSSSVMDQFDEEGFFIGSDSFSQVPESDRDQLRRHMSDSTDTIPVPNSRSSVTYMLALRKAVIKSKGTADPAAGTPTGDEPAILPAWFPKRRLHGPSSASRSNSVIPKPVPRNIPPLAFAGSAAIDEQAEGRQTGRTSWFVAQSELEEDDEPGEIASSRSHDVLRENARLSRRSASEGDITQSNGSDINPYASIDNILIHHRSKKVRPVVPPRPSVIKKAQAQAQMTATTHAVNAPPSVSPPPPPAIAKSAARSSSLVSPSPLQVEVGALDSPSYDKLPPPLPGEEDEGVYTVPTQTLGSPGSASFMPAETNTAGYMAPLPYLVQVCVQYLHNKQVLREEGLFRVSGDITRIRQLKAAFDALENNTNTWSSGRSLATFLEEEINKERDPNTVAGLLKMFLREQNYLNARQCKSLVDTLYPNRTLATLSNSQGDVSVLEIAMREQLPKLEDGDPIRIAAIKVIVRDELSPVAQSVLWAMCRLLAKVAQEGDSNRMTSHSLGMCCGLSVFPAMSTGHASSVLRFMLHNYQEIFG